MLTTSTFRKMEKYIDLLLLHQKNQNQDLVMEYNQGYWWCISDKILNQHERHFLKIGKKSEIILNELQDNKDVKRVVHTLHLLGWVENKKVAGDTLVNYIESKDESISNASLRAIFPLIVTGKYKLEDSLIRRMLYTRNLAPKNKILGLLAYVPKSDMFRILRKKDIKYIEKLTKHRNKPIIVVPAKGVIGRIVR